jgi:phosphoribosylanthranilate isomerase
VSAPHDGPRVKVCGLTRAQDAVMAEAAGAHYLGVILAPGRARSVTLDAARRILGETARAGVGVFVDADADVLRAAADAARLDVLQLHGDEPPALCATLRDAGYTVWKALRPRTADEFRKGAARYAGVVDALLVDGWSAASHGGTGTRFPWDAVAEVRAADPATGPPLVAAGGLRPENVAEAVRILSPFAVDVSSGVERAPGIKDSARVTAFVAAVRATATAQPQDA